MPFPFFWIFAPYFFYKQLFATIFVSDWKHVKLTFFSHILCHNSLTNPKFKKRATALILYVYKDLETVFGMFLAFILLPESVPKEVRFYIYFGFWHKIWPGCQYPGQIKTCFRIKNNLNNTIITLNVTKNILFAYRKQKTQKTHFNPYFKPRLRG